jgi:hypothetical protein
MRRNLEGVGNRFNGRLIKVAILSVSMLHLIPLSGSLKAQDHSRFMKIKKWKIAYSLDIAQSVIVPEDLFPEIKPYLDTFMKVLEESSKYGPTGTTLDPSDALVPVMEKALREMVYQSSNMLVNLSLHLSGADIHSILIEKSNLSGNLLFDEREDFNSWAGEGRIVFNIYMESKGNMHGSSFDGTVIGSGSTIVNSDESWFSIYPGTGTYELFLVPGDEEKSGMFVEVASRNTIWEDISAELEDKLGAVSDEVLQKELMELVNASYQPETDDAFFCTDQERWVVDVENVKLPRTGLIIEGQRIIREGHMISWRIEPAN